MDTIVLEEPRVVPGQTKLFYDFEEIINFNEIETIYDYIRHEVTVLVDLVNLGYEPDYVLSLLQANVEFVEFRINTYGLYPDGSRGKYPIDYSEFYINSKDFTIIDDRLSFVISHKVLSQSLTNKSSRLVVHLVKYYG